jgi:hypothetical protein
MNAPDFSSDFSEAAPDYRSVVHASPAQTCQVCGLPLRGRQTRFCGRHCKNHHLNNRHQSYRCQRARALRNKRRLVQLMGGSCSRCGYGRNLAALEFHHVDSRTKLFSLDARTLANRSWEQVLLEAAKCVLLCSNCHAEQHNPASDALTARQQDQDAMVTSGGAE